MNATNLHRSSLLILTCVVLVSIQGLSQWVYVDAVDTESAAAASAARAIDRSQTALTLDQGVAGPQGAWVPDSARVVLLPSGMSDEELTTDREEQRQRMLEAARAGDTSMQKRVARDLLDDRYGWFDRDNPEAYKWASVAFLEGDRDAKYLLAEFDLFMSSDEREKGRALAEEYLNAKDEARGVRGASTEPEPDAASDSASPKR